MARDERGLVRGSGTAGDVVTPPPLLLDAYCCAGGATKGYQRAGFRVVGVDITPQPRYCGDEFVQGDAIEFITSHGVEFAAIHASPPCQSSCLLTKGTNKGREYPQLIAPTRAALLTTGRPWVIENVVGAPIRADLLLCGEMFNLGVIRHRLFEADGWWALSPSHPRHRGLVAGWRHGPYFAVYGEGGDKGTVEQWQTAMGIDWTGDRHELTESIPPAFTEFIGGHLLAAVRERAA